ncbi:MAG: OmpA family protein, partial [Endomicrobia bacterium]|nr:OmpA family protein [Endomicrobiia bacterium]
YNLRGSKGTFTAKLNNIPEEMTIFGAGNNLLSGKAELGFSADIWKGLEVFAMGSYEKAERFWQVTGETGIGYRFGKTKSKEQLTNNKEQITNNDNNEKREAAERVARIAELKKKINLTRIQFEFDRFNLNPEARRGVEEIAVMLKELKKLDDSVKITIEGHTDDEGDIKYNEWLSKNRATTVHKKLVDLGIESDMFEKQWFGKTRPKATNETEEGRALNRRVEIVVE